MQSTNQIEETTTPVTYLDIIEALDNAVDEGHLDYATYSNLLANTHLIVTDESGKAKSPTLLGDRLVNIAGAYNSQVDYIPALKDVVSELSKINSGHSKGVELNGNNVEHHRLYPNGTWAKHVPKVPSEDRFDRFICTTCPCGDNEISKIFKDGAGVPSKEPCTSDVLKAIIEQEGVIELTFNSAWHNGTGYLNKAAQDKTILQPGQIGWCKDDLGRTIVIQNTGLDNLVCFERYVDNAQLANNMRPELYRYLTNERLSKEEIRNHFTLVDTEDGLKTQLYLDILAANK